MIRLFSLFLFISLFVSCSPRVTDFGVETGKFAANFDHYAINVDDLNESVRFYQKVLDLQEIENGTKKAHIRWLSLGNGMSLHVIESDRSGVKLQKGVHLSISVGAFEEFVAHLRSINLKFYSWQGAPMQTNARPDGVSQVYFQDLDGYWIEVNDSRAIAEGRTR